MMAITRAGKNSRIESPFGVHVWLDGKRIVHFLLLVIELFSLALTAAALLSEICRNRQFTEGMGRFDGKF